ncbi:MAG TPA: type VI secretion system baseplate subunit TssF [Terriglobales bacterium]|nr:type VI secretion system baseplate subunit TssF [Terriglobales bacterium]
MASDDQDELLRYYLRELTYLRRAGVDFAQRYPKVAQRLELSVDEAPDPHVERLLEGFAFLSGRIQQNIEAEFPEITAALLGTLYPHFTQPVPSMAVARLEVDPTQGKMTAGHVIRKHTPLVAPTHDGLTLRFRTCYPVTLWPLEVTYAGFESTDQFDFLDSATDVATVLRIRVETRGGSLSELGLDRLRFFLNGDRTSVHGLYELIFCHAAGVAIIPDGGSRRPVFLPPDALKPVGFEPDEEVLPYPASAHPAYRLLQEYFCFPDKFHFVDVEHLARHGSESSFDLIVMLRTLPRGRIVVDRNTLLLGCTPVVNLFRRTTEPIRLDHRHLEYRLVADGRRERATEIHSITKVSASSSPVDETKTFEPFYSFSHAMEGRNHRAFWAARRVPTNRADVPGTELLLSFLDLDFNPATPPTQTVFAHTLCTNRRLAEQLPAGGALQLEEAAPVGRITVLAKPTAQLDPPLAGQTPWRLISQLSLNYLSLAEGREGLNALREILKLYSFSDHASTHQQVMGIREMACRRVVRRVGADAWRGFCRGFEVSLVFDEAMYVGTGAFLLASVLNRFFALYASINSFTQLVIRSRQREGVWKQWPPAAGQQIVL